MYRLTTFIFIQSVNLIKNDYMYKLLKTLERTLCYVYEWAM